MDYVAYPHCPVHDSPHGDDVARPSQRRWSRQNGSWKIVATPRQPTGEEWYFSGPVGGPVDPRTAQAIDSAMSKVADLFASHGLSHLVDGREIRVFARHAMDATRHGERYGSYSSGARDLLLRDDFKDDDHAVYTLVHELGHALFFESLNFGQRVFHQKQFDAAAKHPHFFVSTYARQDAREDFAETFTHKILGRLKPKSPAAERLAATLESAGIKLTKSAANQHEPLAQRNPPRGDPRGQAFLPLSSIATRREVQAKAKSLIAKARAAGMAVPRRFAKSLFPNTLSSLRLLGQSQKVTKGLKYGVVTTVLYLSPDTEAFSGVHGQGKTLCPWSSPECSAACLGHESGQMGLPDSKNARLWRTVLYTQDRALFNRMLDEEATDFEQRVRQLAPGLIPAIRLDGTSDLGLAKHFAPRHPVIAWYDYSKQYDRMLAYLRGELPRNWHLTFSYSGHNLDQSLDVLRRGGNVAVVFGVPQAKPQWRIEAGTLPCDWHGFPVEDADDSDIRFQDCPGRVAGLRLKYRQGTLQGALDRAGPFTQRMPEGWPGVRLERGWPAVTSERRLPVIGSRGGM